VTCQRIFQLLDLQRDDIFLDIGSGIANTVLQAAFTVGCVSRGIEVVKDRHNIGVNIKEKMMSMYHSTNSKDGSNGTKVCSFSILPHTGI
jgi:cyclopropane fatty-acyl-phospholipid synthase-like methyltransferase